MALTLQDLLNPPTLAQLEEQILGLLAAAGFPITSWRPGDVARTLAKMVARGLLELATLISDIARGGFNSYAPPEWLTLLARELYENERRAATFAQGSFTLTLTSALAGPYTLLPGQLWLTWNGRRYRNTTGTPFGSPLTYPDPVTLNFKAESPGVLSNAPDNALALLTPLAGAVVSASVVTIQGADAESDDSLRARNQGKWGSVGPAANDDGYATWARQASAEVTRVLVQANTPSSGKVRVIVAGSAGGLSGGTLVTLNAFLEARRPLCVIVEALSAGEQALAVEGTVRITSGHPNAGSALAQATDALLALFAKLPIGGVVRLSDLYAAIEAIPGVDSVLLSAPASDTVIASTSVAVPAIALLSELV